MAADQGKTILLGVTGASGAIFARRTLQMLEADARVREINLIISGSGLRVLREELGFEVGKRDELVSLLAAGATRKTKYLLDSDVGASIASGSYPSDGMLVIPCST